MSLTTWEKEFYPITAKEFEKGANDRTLVDHSLRKWRGLRIENLRRHKLIQEGCEIGGFLAIDDRTCALCARYLHPGCMCDGCPIVEVRGDRCDNKKDGEDESPYHLFTCFSNPEPMITLLEEALAVQKARENDRT